MKSTGSNDITTLLSGQATTLTEIGPEGYKLFYGLLILAGLILVLMIAGWIRKRKGFTPYKVIRKKIKTEIKLTKNKLYFPDYITLIIHNKGNADVDIDRPLLEFSNFMLKRKFKLKGVDNYHFYPLYLETGKTHTLRIDLARFYNHDKRLKKYPKVTVTVNTIKGRKLGRKSIMLRKTLFR